MISVLEEWFARLWADETAGQLRPDREGRVIPGRRFRFDFCWPAARVAVEIQGGTWTRGRHTRGEGYARDCEKLALAQIEGWQVYYLTREMIEGEHKRWIGLIAGVIRERMA